MSSMKGDKRSSTLEARTHGGGITNVTLDLIGGVRIFFHFEISGNCFFNILIVEEDAVAVIIKIGPSKLLNSPEDKFMAGLNASFFPWPMPQLATKYCSKL